MYATDRYPGLSTRTATAIARIRSRGQFLEAGQLSALTDGQILSMRNIGAQALQEIRRIYPFGARRPSDIILELRDLGVA